MSFRPFDGSFDVKICCENICTRNSSWLAIRKNRSRGKRSSRSKQSLIHLSEISTLFGSSFGPPWIHYFYIHFWNCSDTCIYPRRIRYRIRFDIMNISQAACGHHLNVHYVNFLSMEGNFTLCLCKLSITKIGFLSILCQLYVIAHNIDIHIYVRPTWHFQHKMDKCAWHHTDVLWL